MTDPTPLDEGRRRTPITDGMANAMVRYGAARQCPGCQLGIPKYPGRYPRFCPRCGDEFQITDQQKARMKESVEIPGFGGDPRKWSEATRLKVIAYMEKKPDAELRRYQETYRLQMSDADAQSSAKDPKQRRMAQDAIEDLSVMDGIVTQARRSKLAKKMESAEALPVVCTSRAVRIQKIIESGHQSFENYFNDLTSSRAVTIPFTALAEHGGAEGVRAFFEGPANGLYYRIEEREDPVIVADFDNSNAKLRMFATTDPRRYLSIDPREDIVKEDSEATFEAPLSEGFLQAAAEKALAFLNVRLAKLWKMAGILRAAKRVWDEAQRGAGVKLPPTATLRIAAGLDDKLRTSLGESQRPAVPALAESITLATALGFGLAVIGGLPLLLKGLAKAAKWLGLARVYNALAHAQHVAHAIESGVIDVAIPDELSYALYATMWKRGWRVGKSLGRSGRHFETDKPLDLDSYLADAEFRHTIESGMYRLLLLFFFVNGAMHILAAPLGALLAGEAAATGVKGVELGQGITRAMQVARQAGPRLARMALENVNPENVRMVEAPCDESLAPNVAATMQMFVSEADAREAAGRLGLALVPSRRLVGESALWALVHERTGYALGKGESSRLMEYFGSGPGGNPYDAAIRGPEQARARQRAIDAQHQRVAGEFAEDKRASAKRQRKPGEGATQIRGGFRIHVGANQQRKPNKDAEKALQNKMNAKRGLRARITGAKKWHRSREGQKLHAALGQYNREDIDAALRAKILDVQERIARYSAGQQRQPVSPHTVGMGESIMEDLGTLRPRSSGGTDQMTARGPQTLDNPQPDDHLEAILRRLIVTQNVDVLQDVEFDETTGSIYLFFDPVLMPDEVQEVLAAIRQERGTIQIIASPDMSLPGESVESDWWVLFLPGPGETAIPDPSLYARNPEDYATKVQAVVMAQGDAPATIAQGIDVGSMLNAAGS